MPASDPWDEMHDELPSMTDHGSRRIQSRRAELEENPPCAECERPIGATGRWYLDGVGGLVPYCASCAAVEFPVL